MTPKKDTAKNTKKNATLEDTIDIEGKIQFREAERNFYRTYAPKIAERGYKLEQGEGRINGELIILARAAYDGPAWRRYALFGLPRAQRRLRRLMPESYEHEGNYYAISFIVESKDRYRLIARLLEKYQTKQLKKEQSEKK